MTEFAVPDRRRYDQFIEGVYQASSGNDRITVTYPYSGEEWADVPNGTHTDVDAAVSAARDAFRSDVWTNSTRNDRKALLRNIADVIDDNTEELATIETQESGGTITDTSARIANLGETFRYFADLISQLDGRALTPDSTDGNRFSYVTKKPYGVVGAITPWNAPLNLAAIKIAPALAAGNTFVHKPSEKTPIGAYRFAELIYEKTDIPPGVYNIVSGDGETGAALADHDGLDKLAFTGSTEVGRTVGSKAGEKIIPVTLELGGKSPNIVFKNADIEDAVTGAMNGAFIMSGQFCMAGSRILVQDEVYDEFLDRIAERSESITLGDPLDPETDLGPIAFKEQWESVRKYIEIGAEEATLAYRSDKPEDAADHHLVAPTIFADVDNDSTIAQEEIFGPVVSVTCFSDEDEAIEIANDTRYGLVAAVWSGDICQAQRIADQIDAGTVWINEYNQRSLDVPLGGFKDSGVGRELGPEGLSEYYQTKTVWISTNSDVASFFD